MRKAMPRALALSLSVLLVAFAFLSVLLAAGHAAHDCMDFHCSLCVAILGARTLLRQLLPAALSALLLVAAAACGLFPAGRASHRKAKTPITLKTRLNP